MQENISRCFFSEHGVQNLSTAEIDTLIRPLVHCALQQCDLLATRTQVRKVFTLDVGKMQRRRHHMTAGGL